MADHQRKYSALIFVALFSCLAYSAYSYQFVAGGKDGWVVKPSEDYNQWAQRMRFQVNDTILFKYKSGSDSVLVVNKDDYDKCNTANPLRKLDDGNSIVKFDRSGAFYFISGNKASCDQGQKLHIVVMAVRSPPSPPKNVPPQGSASPSPSPAGATSPSPSGGGAGPATSPSPSGGGAGPATSPSPSGGGAGPATSPSPSGGASAPATSPSSMSPSPAGSGTGEGPSPMGDMPMPGSPGSSVPGAPGSSTPGSGTPAEANSPPAPPGSVAAPPCSTRVSLPMVLSVGLSLSMFVFAA